MYKILQHSERHIGGGVILKKYYFLCGNGTRYLEIYLETKTVYKLEQVFPSSERYLSFLVAEVAQAAVLSRAGIVRNSTRIQQRNCRN